MGIILPVVDAPPPYSDLIGRPIDNTALRAFRACPRRYYYSMVKHYRNPELALPPGLNYGRWWHLAMEVHYKTNGDRALVHGALQFAWKDCTKEGDYRTLPRLLMEYDNYLRTYGTPEDEARRGFGRTVGWPDTPLIEIPIEVHFPGVRHPYVIRLDRVYELNGLNYIEDHKTASRFEDGYFQEFEMSPQMMGYMAGAEEFLGFPIAGVRINLHLIYKQKSAFDRALIAFSKEKLAEFRRVTDHTMWKIEEEHLAEARGEQAWEPNWDSCHERYGACAYLKNCSVTEGERRQQSLELDYPTPTPWDPMSINDTVEEA